MYAPHCSTCDRRVLLGHDRLLSLRSAAGRHEATLRCRCGNRVRWVAATARATSL